MDGHLTLLHLWRSGVYFRQLVWLSPSDVVMSWLRLQTPVKCIPHPYHMYTKCFNILICCGWAHESTPTLLCLCNKWGGDFRKIGVWLSPSDVVMSWVHLFQRAAEDLSQSSMDIPLFFQSNRHLTVETGDLRGVSSYTRWMDLIVVQLPA